MIETGRSQKRRERTKMSITMRKVGISIRIRVMRTGPIDDLSRCVNIVTHKEILYCIGDARSSILSFLSLP